ncbi:MAG: hypothetical protein JNN30_02505 [Rhodanobacteraceae bacterium]|nr:hypothetical protein [Rhodanobacteraceae bacterium]
MLHVPVPDERMAGTPVLKPAYSGETKNGEEKNIGGSGAGRAGGIVVQLQACHNGVDAQNMRVFL